MNSLLITNKNQNPNEFNCKLGQNLIIPPYSEIALEKMRFTNKSSVNINESNNTFVLLFGQSDLPSEKAIVTPAIEFMPPELLKIKPGQYSLFSSNLEKYDQTINTEPNIIYGLVDALNTSKYFMWGWTGEYQTEITAKIGCYVKDFNIGNLSWNPSCTLGGIATVATVAATAGSPAYNTILDTPNGYFIFTKERAPLPFHSGWNTTPSQASPAEAFTVTLPAYGAGAQMNRFFAGYVTDKENSVEIDGNNIKNNFVLSVEADESSNELKVVLNNFEGETEVEAFSGFIYTGAAELKIVFEPQIINTIAGAATDTVRQLVKITIGDGVNPDYGRVIDLDSRFIGHDYYYGLCSKSEGTITVQTYGTDETHIDNSNLNELGNIGFGNTEMEASIFMSRILQNIELKTNPECRATYNFSRLTRQCNLMYLLEGNDIHYSIDGDDIEIDIQNSVEEFNICLNIDNLPIKSHLSNPELGMIQKRIYTLFSNVSYGEPVVENPYKLKFIKLYNKSPLNLNNLQIRFSNLDGSTSNNIEGNVYISLLIKENMRIKNKSYIDSNNYDNTEQVFDMSNKII